MKLTAIATTTALSLFSAVASADNAGVDAPSSITFDSAVNANVDASETTPKLRNMSPKLKTRRALLAEGLEGIESKSDEKGPRKLSTQSLLGWLDTSHAFRVQGYLNLEYDQSLLGLGYKSLEFVPDASFEVVRGEVIDYTEGFCAGKHCDLKTTVAVIPMQGEIKVVLYVPAFEKKPNQDGAFSLSVKCPSVNQEISSVDSCSGETLKGVPCESKEVLTFANGGNMAWIQNEFDKEAKYESSSTLEYTFRCITRE